MFIKTIGAAFFSLTALVIFALNKCSTEYDKITDDAQQEAFIRRRNSRL